MRLTFERQLELEARIMDKGDWAAYKTRLEFLQSMLIQGKLKEPKFFELCDKSTAAFAV